MIWLIYSAGNRTVSLILENDMFAHVHIEDLISLPGSKFLIPTKMNVKFKRWNCVLKKEQYVHGGANALMLLNPKNGEMIAVASVNLENEPINDDEVFIKDYSENEGMLKTLVDAKVVSEPIKWVQSGFVKIPLCKLLI